jgi:hypothetical protein
VTGPWVEVEHSGLPPSMSMSGATVPVGVAVPVPEAVEVPAEVEEVEEAGVEGADVVPKGTDIRPMDDIGSSHHLNDTSTANPSKLPPDQKRCTATSKRTKLRCARYQTPGLSVCRWHGGGTQASKAAAKRNLATRSAQAIVATHDVEPMASPIDSLLKIARRVELVAELIGDRLNEASDADAGERLALIGAYRGALADCAKVTAQVVALGLVERRLGPPEEDTARAWGTALNATIVSDELGLAYETIETFRRLLRENFAKLIDA